MSFKYLQMDEVLQMHAALIERYGGSYGLRDQNALESALMRPQTGYYNDILEEAAALLESLAVNHPFVDGNKRIAFAVADTFLRINGYFIDCDNREAYDFFINLFETNRFNFANLTPWLKSCVKQRDVGSA